MEYLNFEQANCQHCYKCIRHCHVKAIEMVDKQAKIVPDLCIGCGNCFHICPQNAKHITTDINDVKNVINNGEKLIVSLAPAFASYDHLDDPMQFITALKQLGFYQIEETAIGAVNVSEGYKDIYTRDQQHIITSSCPSVNFLITKYYPEYAKYLAPVLSPMMAHNRLIKTKHKDVKTVFIGPCIVKKEETRVCTSPSSCIDFVITFDDVRDWLQERNIDVTNCAPSPFDLAASKATKWYPLSGGIVKATDFSESPRRIITIDGVASCKQLLDHLSELSEPTWIEMNACEEGCINGYGNHDSKLSLYKKSEAVRQYIQQDTLTTDTYTYRPIDIDFDYTTFASITTQTYSEKEIQATLLKLGKPTEADELNCGGCGYQSCRDKAKAILDGKATIEMCLPHMRMISEEMNNIIISHTPNAVIVCDKDFHIIEFNRQAVTAFNTSKQHALYMPVDTILGENLFQSLSDQTPTATLKKRLNTHKKIFDITLQYLPHHHLYLGIFKDITSLEEDKIKRKQTSLDVLEMAQNVIDKQMVVAHEIASLLGETTAETKVTLSQLKELFNEDHTQ